MYQAYSCLQRPGIKRPDTHLPGPLPVRQGPPSNELGPPSFGFIACTRVLRSLSLPGLVSIVGMKRQRPKPIGLQLLGRVPRKGAAYEGEGVAALVQPFVHVSLSLNSLKYRA